MSVMGAGGSGAKESALLLRMDEDELARELDRSHGDDSSSWGRHAYNGQAGGEGGGYGNDTKPPEVKRATLHNDL